MFDFAVVQVSNTATPDTISKLETKVEKLDKTLADIRAGSLEELLKNTTDLKAKVCIHSIISVTAFHHYGVIFLS